MKRTNRGFAAAAVMTVAVGAVAAGGPVSAGNGSQAAGSGGTGTAAQPFVAPADATTERLDRGLVGIRNERGNFVSWRLLASDAVGTAFNVYRDGSRVNAAPVTTATSYLDAGAPADATYTVRPVAAGVELATTAADTPVTPFATSQDVPLQLPPGGTTPS